MNRVFYSMARTRPSIPMEAAPTNSESSSQDLSPEKKARKRKRDCELTEEEKKQREYERTILPKVKRQKPSPMDGTIIHFKHISEVDLETILTSIEESNNQLADLDEPEIEYEVYEGERCLLKMDPLEEQAMTLAYRKAYRQLPRVIDKRNEKSKDPAVIEARKAYGKLETVKDRKKRKAKAQAELKKYIREHEPSVYKKFMVLDDGTKSKKSRA